MSVEQSGSDIKGRFEGALGLMHYEGTVKSDEIHFTHLAMAGSVRFDYIGRLEDANRMSGRATFGQLGQGTWTATRIPAQ